MLLHIRHPATCLAEREYIYKVLLEDFLGLEYSTNAHNGDTVIISALERSIELPDIFFSRADKCWLDESTLPQRPLIKMNVEEIGLKIEITDSEIPIIYGLPNIDLTSNFCRLGIDVFGSAFFMLSRYEEAVLEEVDDYGRFPSSSSLARQEKFLLRPIVNEYLEILWVCMKKLWPDLERKKRVFRKLISCDVDIPYSPGVKSFYGFVRSIVGDIFKRRCYRSAVSNILNAFLARTGDFRLDPYFTFDWMMDVNEKAGSKIVFFFVGGKSHPKHDSSYSLDEPVISDLLKQINRRGHEIGLHLSYNSYCDVEQMKKEASTLRQVMKENGTNQLSFGTRLHFLRWNPLVTAKNLKLAGIDYDSSLSYADHVGFRCGTCYDYPLYDLRERCSLELLERPLLAMDASLFGSEYMDLRHKEAALILRRLMEICKLFNGNFTLLWHNNHLYSTKDKNLYQMIIGGNIL